MKHTNWTKLLSVVPATLMAFVMVLFTGCASDKMAGPQTQGGESSGTLPPALVSPNAATPSVGLSSSGWYEIASAEVEPDDEKTVGGGRYGFYFPEGAVSQTTTITISEWDSHVLDVEFGPHGTQFNLPVTLEIDYSSTNADPDSDNYNGAIPAFYWFDQENDVWVEIQGDTDTENLIYTVELEHFSRYSLRGTPGW